MKQIKTLLEELDRVTVRSLASGQKTRKTLGVLRTGSVLRVAEEYAPDPEQSLVAVG